MWRKIQKFLAVFLPSILLLIYIGVVICMLNRWDPVTPITLIPIWGWALMGMFASLLCWIFFRGFLSVFVFCVWLITGIGFSEETHGLARELAVSLHNDSDSEESRDPSASGRLRVVNVEANASEEGLRKVLELEPDIVIVQNAPDESVLESFADELFGTNRSVAVNQSNAIVARGEFRETLAEPGSTTLHVRLRTREGVTIDITNLDLERCAPRLDMWHPDVWEELIEARRRNRRLIRNFLGVHELTGEKSGRIVSGGFGTPPGDDAFRPLANTDMLDAFGEAGIGWGNTFPSEYPLLRLDQVWVSDNLAPVKATARVNPASAHRIVVCDLELTEN